MPPSSPRLTPGCAGLSLTSVQTVAACSYGLVTRIETYASSCGTPRHAGRAAARSSSKTCGACTQPGVPTANVLYLADFGEGGIRVRVIETASGQVVSTFGVDAEGGRRRTLGPDEKWWVYSGPGRHDPRPGRPDRCPDPDDPGTRDDVQALKFNRTARACSASTCPETSSLGLRDRGEVAATKLTGVSVEKIRFSRDGKRWLSRAPSVPWDRRGADPGRRERPRGLVAQGSRALRCSTPTSPRTGSAWPPAASTKRSGSGT